jgi:hypothetical protein
VHEHQVNRITSRKHAAQGSENLLVNPIEKIRGKQSSGSQGKYLFWLRKAASKHGPLPLGLPSRVELFILASSSELSFTGPGALASVPAFPFPGPGGCIKQPFR